MTKFSIGTKPSQIFFITVCLMTVKLFGNLPALIIRNSVSGAPLTAVISGLAVFFTVFIITKKIYAENNSNIISVAEKKFSNAVKYILSIICIVFFFFSAVFTLAEISSFCKLIAFPSSPFWFVSVFFVGGSILGAFFGARSLFRTAPFVFFAVLAVLFILAVSTPSRSSFSNLFPLLGISADRTFLKGLAGITIYSDIIAVFFLIPTSDRTDSAKRAILSGTAVSVILVFVFILAYTARIPYPLSAMEKYPLYILSKEVYFGRFFQRIDAFLLLASSLSGMLSLSVNLLLITKILCRLFDITAKNVVLFPSAIIVFLLSFGINLFPDADFMQFLLLAVFIFALSALTVILFLRKEKATSHED